MNSREVQKGDKACDQKQRGRDTILQARNYYITASFTHMNDIDVTQKVVANLRLREPAQHWRELNQPIASKY